MKISKVYFFCKHFFDSYHISMGNFYERQIIVEGWGRKGQEKLFNTTLAIVGVGGLGSPLSIYLTVAGIGRIKLFDKDVVSESNLNRQILYTPDDIGKPKVEIAAKKLSKMNPTVIIESFQIEITKDNIDEYLQDVDGIVDALDNMRTRMLLNKYAVEHSIPLFHGAIYGWEGRITTIIPGGPCLACLYGENPADITGVFPAIGGVVGTVATVQVQEVIKFFLGTGKLLDGRLLIWDGKNSRMIEVKYDKQDKCPVCGGEL